MHTKGRMAAADGLAAATPTFRRPHAGRHTGGVDINLEIDPFSDAPASRNGARRTPPDADARSIRKDNARRRAVLESQRLSELEQLAKRRRVTESAGYDWVTPYLDLTQRDREMWVPLGPAHTSQRKRGQSWPIFRTEQELALLRFPARLLLSTNTYAMGMRSGIGCYLLGRGATYQIKPRPRLKDVPTALTLAVQDRVDQFLELNEWAGGEQPPIEKEFYERSVEDGDTILLSFPQDGPETLVRFTEPEMLTDPGTEVECEWVPESIACGGLDHLFGVITPVRDVARPLGYYIQFGDVKSDGECLPPERVLHFRRNARRNQKRGITDFAFGELDLLDQASKLLGNSGNAAAEQAAIVAVRKHLEGTPDQIRAFALDQADTRRPSPYNSRDEYVRQSRRGETQDIGPGTQYVEGPAATNAVAHMAVLAALLRGAAVKWNAPEWIASADASNTVFASSLTAESPFVIRIGQEQGQYSAAWRRVVWNAVRHSIQVDPIVAAGRTWTWEDVRKLLDLVVTLPSPIARNRLEEAQTAATEIPLGVQSPQQYCEMVGRDYQQVQSDLDEHVRNTGGAGDPLQLPPDDPNLQ